MTFDIHRNRKTYTMRPETLGNFVGGEAAGARMTPSWLILIGFYENEFFVPTPTQYYYYWSKSKLKLKFSFIIITIGLNSFLIWSVLLLGLSVFHRHHRLGCLAPYEWGIEDGIKMKKAKAREGIRHERTFMMTSEKSETAFTLNSCKWWMSDADMADAVPGIPRQARGLGLGLWLG